MKKLPKIILISLLLITSLSLNIMAEEEVIQINLSSTQNSDGTYSHTATINNETVNEYDYTWNIDPSVAHNEVKNSPAEYYSGTKPSEEDDVYIAHDIYYYPELDTSKFVKQQYDDEVEWCYYYDIEEYQDYIFATLPVEGNDVPTRMMHSASEAYSNAVLHINKAGTYKLTGNWHGQVFIDLGEDSFSDPSQVVTLILNGVDIECTVASGICFYQVYEVDNAWEERNEVISTIDTTAAGAKIIICDDTTNSVTGANIYRILKTKYKSDDTKVQKKALKIDGGLYSFMSLNITGQDKGNGILNINSQFEGLDSELHLTINSGNINIISDNDGINVNEDDVSIFTMNGGTLQILAGTGYEGDGIDSNGYIVINGGTIISSGKPQADSGLDSDKGTYINAGTVIATGSSMDVVSEYSEDAKQVTANLVFSSQQKMENSIIITDDNDSAIFAYDLSLNNFFANQNRTYQCLIVSCEQLQVGQTYHFYSSASLTGSQENGIYTKIKKMTGGNQLSYTSAGYTEMGFTGMMNQGMQNFNDQRPDTKPDSTDQVPGTPNGEFNMENRPEGFNHDDEKNGEFDMSDMPEGFNPEDIKEAPNSFNEMPEGFNKTDIPQNANGFGPNQFSQNQTSSIEASNEFLMEDKVNTFLNISMSQVTETTNNSIPTSTFIFIGSGILLLGAFIGAITIIAVQNKKHKEEQ